MPFPHDHTIVFNAIRDARTGLTLTRVGALTPPDGGSAWGPDGYGNSGTNNPDGTNYRLDLSLSKPAAWLQPSVYIASGVGLVLGFVAMLKFGGK